MKISKFLSKAAACALAATILTVPFTAQAMAAQPASPGLSTMSDSGTVILENSLPNSSTTCMRDYVTDTSNHCYGKTVYVQSNNGVGFELNDFAVFNFGGLPIDPRYPSNYNPDYDIEKLISAKVQVSQYGYYSDTKLDLYYLGTARWNVDELRDQIPEIKNPCVTDVSPGAMVEGMRLDGTYEFDVTEFMYEQIKANPNDYYGYMFAVGCSDVNTSTNLYSTEMPNRMVTPKLILEYAK